MVEIIKLEEVLVGKVPTMAEAIRLKKELGLEEGKYIIREV